MQQVTVIDEADAGAGRSEPMVRQSQLHMLCNVSPVASVKPVRKETM